MNSVDGQGVMNYPAGDQYDGGWVDGMKFGQGVFLFVNGTTCQK